MPSSTSTSPRDIILHRRSRVFGKRPLASDIQQGEIAINFREDDLGLYIKDREDNIRKIGGVFYSDSAPDPSIAIDGWPDLSHGELWLKKQDPQDPESKAQLWVWNKYANSGTGDWIQIGIGTFGILDDYLDQFKDGEDGGDYIHTDRNKLKINNKAALKGLSTVDGDKLIINDEHNFETGVTLNANNLVIDSTAIEASSNSIALSADTPYNFQTDSASGTSETTFTYENHGLFNGEEVFVEQYLNDGTTSSGVTQGNYKIAEASLNTFKLYDGLQNVLATGNVRIRYSPQLLLDKNYNVIQSGNFKIKGLSEVPDISQIEEGTWDIYQNTTNGNIRVYSRVGNTVSQPDSAVISIHVKNISTESIPAGHPVYFAGTDPIKRIVHVSAADSADANKMKAIGLTQKVIPASSYGDVTIFGPVKKLNTSALDGATGLDDAGKTLYVKSGGGLTLTIPPADIVTRQPIGVLYIEDSTDGEIFVNHPSLISNDLSQFDLPENYIWVGTANNAATAHRLNADSFKTFIAGDSELEISLADEIKFGGYEFLWDGTNSGSKVQTKITSSNSVDGDTSTIIIDSFSTNYRSAKFFVQVSSLGINPNFQITELLVVHNGSVASVVDYATACTSGPRMGDFTANVKSDINQVVILFNGYYSTQDDVEIKVVRTAVIS